MPLPVLIHQQILCYRHGAARVLNGRCAPINKAKFDLSGLFTYKGTTYLLQGGTLDLFSGIMEGAVLHEFVDFNELWTGTPSYSESTDYNTDTPGTGHSGGNAGGAVPGGGGSSVSISDVATSGGKIVKITINGVDTEIKNKVEWGSSGSNKAELYVNNEPKTVLTDGWTELPSVTSSDNGKVLKVVSGHWTKGTVSGGGSVNEKCAPRVMLRRQAQVQGQHAWFFDVSHPVLQNVSGAEAVLMVYSRKRSRYSQGGTDKTRGSNSRGWAAALGKDAGAAFTMIGRDVLDLKTYLIQNYMCAVGQASLDTMTLSQFQNGASTAYRAFGHVSYSNGATFLAKTRRSRVFGIAVRYENPDFTAAVSGTVSDHTTMVNVGGNAVGRWIYTDVEKIRAVCQYNTDTSKWEIGFNIIE